MAERAWLQQIVQKLMQTLLEDYPTLLSHEEKGSLMDADYCKNVLGLRLTFPLLSNERIVNGQPRYWVQRYGGYYVCSEWWKDHHEHNAEALHRFVRRLVSRKPNHPGVPVLKRHAEALEEPATASDSLISPRAWRTYAAAVITGVAGTSTHDEIPALCHMAAEIADEMVRREAERAEVDDG